MINLILSILVVLITASANTKDFENYIKENKFEEKLSLENNMKMAAVTCFKTGERTSGMNKICFYDCLGSEVAITISNVALCPLSIKN